MLADLEIVQTCKPKLRKARYVWENGQLRYFTLPGEIHRTMPEWIRSADGWWERTRKVEDEDAYSLA